VPLLPRLPGKFLEELDLFILPLQYLAHGGFENILNTKQIFILMELHTILTLANYALFLLTLILSKFFKIVIVNSY
jgi:hypothetical protein